MLQTMIDVIRMAFAAETGTVSIEYALVGAGIFVVVALSIGATGEATLELLRSTCSAVSRSVGGAAC